MVLAENFYNTFTESDQLTTDKPKVLLVEDDEIFQKCLSIGLSSEYNILIAENGVEAYELAKNQIPDIILTDFLMPEMDGVSLCHEIKSDTLTCHIPVIILTSREDTHSKLHGLQNGADDYIYKSSEFEEISWKIRNWLKRRRLLQEKTLQDAFAGYEGRNSTNEDDRFLLHLKRLVDDRMAEPELSVEYVSKEIGLSRVQLYRKVMALTGLSVSEYIRKLRIQRATFLFCQGHRNVTHVAYDVGFNNLSYFAKCFKEECGSLPSEYIARVGAAGKSREV